MGRISLFCVFALSLTLAVSGCKEITGGKWGGRKATPEAEWKTGTKLLFAGDTDFGVSYGKMILRTLKRKGYDGAFVQLDPLLQSADLVIANLETPVTDLKESPFKESKTYVHFAEPDKAPKYLKKHNIKVVSLANNHTLDYGVPGLLQTFDVLEKEGMTWFGAGKNLDEALRPYETTLSAGTKNVPLAVFGAFEYSRTYDRQYDFFAKPDKPGAAPLTEDAFLPALRAYREAHPDAFIVAYPHWGGNYSWMTRKQEKLAPKILDAGANVIVGHGAHTMQEFARVGEKWAVYNIGNFVFNSPGRYRKMKTLPFGMAAVMRFSEAGDRVRADMRLYPIHSDNRVTKFEPRPLTGEEFERAKEALAKRMGEEGKFDKDIAIGKDDFGHFFEINVM